MRRWLPLLFLLSVASADDDWRFWLPQNREAQRDYEARLTDAVSPERLRGHHDRLASRPHRAGSPGDLAVVEGLVAYFGALGLEVEKQEIWCYLPAPVLGEVEVVAPERVGLPVKEEAVDSFSGHAEASIGWNAFSGSGEATGEVVYANYGRKEDYEKLDELGVELKGRIVLARYGGNFRGYKVRFAEARGAAALVLFTDPIDSGYFKGLMYPEGGYAGPSSIQRGSILVLPYRGDPLTPFHPATRDAKRLDPETVAFPAVPVQPVGWRAAREILKRMRGAAVPEGWQGALPFTYRLTGGKALRVRVKVEQERKLVKTFNVTATLRGRRHPEQLVLLGSHHDAWDFGAGDPAAGTILMLETARCFAEAARAGRRPARSIVFCAWAAEEQGIMGSVEWVEAHRERLSRNAVAYINLDAAAMGPELHASAAPSLKAVIGDAFRAEGHELKKLGDLGGGSDHLGFYCHLAIPSAGLSGGGSRGVAYHSLYDNLDWYRKVVGSDYEAARRLTRVVNRVVARLANGDLIPLDPVQYGVDVKRHLEKLAERGKTIELPVKRYEARAREVYGALLEKIARGDAGDLDAINGILLRLERAWLHEDGLAGRPWYRNLYAAPDEDSGYAAWMLPGLRRAVERGDDADLAMTATLYRGVFEKLQDELDRVPDTGRSGRN